MSKDTSGKGIERFIQRYQHRLELIRTLVPLVVLCLQILILIKLS